MLTKAFFRMLVAFSLAGACLAEGAEPRVVKTPAGVVERQVRHRDLPNGVVYDLTASTFRVNFGGPYGEEKPLPPGVLFPGQTEKLRIVPNENQYLLILEGDKTRDLTVRGGSFIGVQHRDLSWRVMKLLYDGAGVLVKTRGVATFENNRFENVMDAIRPGHRAGRFLIKGAYARYIRDDFVENDFLQAGEITDTLVDGTFMFLSCRPARPDEPEKEWPKSTNVVRITDSAVRIMAMPYDPRKGKIVSTDGLAPGTVFKWSDRAGTVEAANCVFYLEAVDVSGRKGMAFPRGRYRNVTVVWGGEGDYPAPLPDGVAVTRDRKVWEKARADWFARHNLPVLDEPVATVRMARPSTP